ncbi:WLM domain-domain-containing protein [Syncephalastrum racemosum]|uniref:WLM domain-domain-containing protein n=1 Tax=Syncephalastrum racemosum TaxID=13706 RepID=A0A1X2HBE4_SYNRA|nr:WLM domain-domain-containing protein [Syncephalastrum racemosum]
MLRRGWRVRHLCEFFPKNPNLLGVNVNHGLKINIRLRPHYDDTMFLEYHDLLGTMLHELTHIVRGPHDAVFYKVLDELNDELDQLLITGGDRLFDGPGYSLGGGGSLSPSEMKRRAIAAAEKRKNLQKVMMPSGGQRLGGSMTTAGFTPAQMAARAAERRLRDQLWCGGAQEGEDEQEDTDSPLTIRTVVLNDDDGSSDPSNGRFGIDPWASPPRGQKRRFDGPAGPVGNRKPRRRIPQPATISASEATISEEWPCPACTFQNKGIALACEMCFKERPSDAPGTNTNLFWPCPQCTFYNSWNHLQCTICSGIKPADTM